MRRIELNFLVSDYGSEEKAKQARLALSKKFRRLGYKVRHERANLYDNFSDLKVDTAFVLIAKKEAEE